MVALIVIGPEDLPRMFRALGRITAKARGMAREFSMAMDDAARSSGIEDAAKSLRDVKSMTSSKALGLDALDRAAQLADDGGVAGGVVATGSIVTVGEVRLLLGVSDVERPVAPPVEVPVEVEDGD